MRTVFLSYHFGPTDKELVQNVETLLESHNLVVKTGEVLGGAALTPAVMKRIDAADALVALMTPSTATDAIGHTHPWVVAEYNYAKGLKPAKRAIAVVFPGVTIPPPYALDERIDYDPNDPLKAFLKLSRTIGDWKAEMGRLVRAQVLPAPIADQLAAGAATATCRYCLCSPDGTKGEWQEARVLPEGDGTFAYLPHVTDDARIQLRVELGSQIWSSRVLPQWMPIELK